ncbi:MAG: hypothetical protein JWP89_3477 [Schlesneria sp.]|nr:hypothetical protein [Schlesneria sp.]
MVSPVSTPPQRRKVALWVRLLLAGLMVSVLTSSHAVTSANPRTVVFALDVSDSIPSTDQALAYFTDTAERSLTKPDQLGLVVFGQQATVEVPPVSKIQMEPIESRIDRKATNLEEALDLSLMLISKEATGRVVLISDGIATSGDVTRILPKLKSRGIAVDVLPVEYAYTNEVWLDGLQLPARDRTGRSDEAIVLLSALTDGVGTLTVGDNGIVVAAQEVAYKSGTNQFLIPLPAAGPGYHQYFANIEAAPSQDALKQNNTVSNALFVDGVRKVLLVTNGLSQRLALPPLEAAISKAARQIEMIGPRDLPADVSQLGSYDSIIFCDVNRSQFEAAQLQAVHDAVCDQGVGFLMTGSANSFGPGGYHDTAIEQILPVSLGAPDTSPSRVALAIVMDRLQIPEGTTRAKRLTKQALKILRPSDESCVLVGDGRDGKLLCPLASASHYEQQVPVINGAEFNSIQLLENVMQMGLKELQNSTAGTRQMLIILGGRPIYPSRALLQEFVTARISVSVVMSPRVPSLPKESTHEDWMRSVVETTGGRYYSASDPNQLFEILGREASFIKSDLLCHRIFTPLPGTDSEIVSDLGTLPTLDGYVVTIPKRGDVTHVLNVPPANEAFDSLHPLLSIWRPGFGKSAALMTDLNSTWGREWQKWDQFQRFVRQLLAELHRSEYLWMSTRVTGDEALIVLNDIHPDESRLTIDVKVIGPDEKAVTVTPDQIGPRAYQVRVPLWGYGHYRVAAMTARGDIQESSYGGFAHAVKYSPEYLQFRSQRQTLQQIAAATGGTILTGNAVQDAVYSRIPRTFKQVPEASFDWFLVALALLVPVDALARRMWADAAEALEERIHPIPAPSSPTMVGLFRTKEWVTAALSTRGTARMLVQIWSPPPVRTAIVPPLNTADQTVFADNSSASTIEKLLILKRQNNEHS